jgi:hypothetical protein
VTGLRITNGLPPIRLQGVQRDLREHNTEASGEAWFGSPWALGAAEKLRRDTYAQRAVQGVIGPLVQSFFDFEPASRTNPLDVEIARFCERNFFSGLFSWIEVLEQALGYLWDGFSVFEWIERVAPVSRDEFPQHPGRGLGVWIGSLAHRPAWSITALHPRKDDASKLLEAWQYTHDDEFVRIPASKVLRFAFKSGGNDLYGFAPARPMYGPHRAKVLLCALEMVQHERAHVGTPQLLTEAGVEVSSEDLEAAEKMLAELRSAERGYVIPPPGTKVEYTTTKGTTDVRGTIEDKNREILATFAGNHELLGSSTSSGSYALAGVQKSVREVVVEHHGQIVVDTINYGRDGWSPVERLVRANYGPGVALPRAVLRSTPLRNTQALAEMTEKLVKAGVWTSGDDTEEFLREASGMPQERRPRNKEIATP